MDDCYCVCHGIDVVGILGGYHTETCEHCQPLESEDNESATDILKKRLARGEIDEDEYWHTKDILDS